jgi:hypothetical protein
MIGPHTNRTFAPPCADNADDQEAHDFLAGARRWLQRSIPGACGWVAAPVYDIWHEVFRERRMGPYIDSTLRRHLAAGRLPHFRRDPSCRIWTMDADALLAPVRE